MGKVKLEDLESRGNNLSKEVSNIGTDVLNLKEKMKDSKADKIMTVQNEPSCKNCKSDGW